MLTTMNHQTKTQKLTTLAMLTAISLVIFVVESYLPTLVPIPGVKLGLANIITLVVLQLYKPKDALMVLLVRIILASIFTGQMVSFFYSLAGGLACFLVMTLVNAIYRGRWIYLTSIFGAIAHNCGQLLVAYFVVQSIGLAAYAPYLMVSAIITGLFTGLCAHFTLSQLHKIL